MLDTLGPMVQIQALLEAVPGMGTVQIGAPLSWSTQTSAYITVGKQPTGEKTTGSMFREAAYFVDIGYRCDDNLAGVTTAETVLAAALDALQQAIFDDKTLAGTCQNADIDTGLSDEPEYRMRAGKEFREFPVVILCRQYTTFNPTP